MKTVLFDLDNTLIINDMDEFLPAYFGTMAMFVNQTYRMSDFTANLIRATQKAIANTNERLTNAYVFWEDFEKTTGVTRVKGEPIIRRYYTEKFPTISHTVTENLQAHPLLEYCFAQGWRVVVATNPLFPPTAIEQRMGWGNLLKPEYPFDLVTDFENSHATKPQIEYYQEIMEKMGVEPANCLMVGDDWKNDIEPTNSLGMQTFWVPMNDEVGVPEENMADGVGDLGDLLDKLKSGWW